MAKSFGGYEDFGESKDFVKEHPKDDPLGAKRGGDHKEDIAHPAPVKGAKEVK